MKPYPLILKALFLLVPFLSNAQGILIQSGANMVTSGTTHIVVNNAGFTNNGTFTKGTGIVNFTGTAAISISGAATDFYDLTLSGPSAVTMASNGSVAGTLTVSGSTVFDADGVANDKVFTLKSSGAGTANVTEAAASGSDYITGNVTVERYIPADPTRAWRFLSVPTNSSQSINAAWQNGQASTVVGANNIGTWLTSNVATATSLGYDAQTSGNSMLSYNPATNAWVGVTTNTATTNIATGGGYLLFVRGDRRCDNTNPFIYETTLSTTGTLKQRDQAAITVTAGEFKDIGNPFASAINVSTVLSATPSISQTFYVWDPRLTTGYSSGGYQTFSSINGWLPSPGGGGTGDSANFLIQSGQAFFVHNSTGSDVGIAVTEASKTTGSINVFSPTTTLERLKTTLYAIPGNPSSVVDGNTVVYNNAYSNAVDGNDAVKMTNFGENFGILRDGIFLVVEGRQVIPGTDTVFFKMTNMKQQTYQLKFVADNLNHPFLDGKLIDNYLSTSTPVKLNDTTYINFTVDATPGSYATGRFTVVFYTAAPLPVTFTGVKASQQNNDIAVEWSVDNQVNIQKYEVEKSTDGRSFSKVCVQQATGINGTRVTYNWLDVNAVAGDNYYRVRSIGIGGESKYSNIVIVKIGKGNAAITVYPNPVTNKNITLQFTDMAKGLYIIKLLNNLGQTIMTAQVIHQGGSAAQTLAIDKSIVRGYYQLLIIKPDNDRLAQKIMIAE